MSVFIGIDTSNYTSSVAVYNSETKEMISNKLLLPVEENKCGLRQSDAVFHHVKQIGAIVKDTLAGIDDEVLAVGVSLTPCDDEKSYMPCFLVGKLIAEVLSAAYKVKTYYFSHQRGHIAAALYSAGCLNLFNEPFLAFHISGGTTDLLKVQPDEKMIIKATQIGKSLDLKAGQAIDRVGVMLGLKFPCGCELEKLSEKSERAFNVKPCIKGLDCALSGIENQAHKMKENGENDVDIAKYCLDFIEKTIDEMCSVAVNIYPNLPIVFAGGVMSNKKINKHLSNKFNAFFAEPKYSSDNAAGIAILCKTAYERNL